MTGDDAYDLLTEAARSDRWDPFDIHVAASILTLAMGEAATGKGSLGDRSGLDEADLLSLGAQMFPGQLFHIARQAKGAAPKREVEEESVHDLLMAHACGASALERPFAAMIARRAMEPGHLWQDLGLRDRGELGALLDRHFAALARQNTGNMKWKRFFYRRICEDEGFVLCATPICDDCSDYDECFGEETGEAHLGGVTVAKGGR